MPCTLDEPTCPTCLTGSDHGATLVVTAPIYCPLRTLSGAEAYGLA